MQKIFIVSFLYFIGNFSFSQLTRIEGNIEIDSADATMGQFIIYSLPDSALVKGSYIDSTFFYTEFNAVQNADYYLKISVLGYPDTLIPFKAQSTSINVGTIRLQAGMLNTVEFVYKKPEFIRTLDGIKVNVDGTTLQTLSTLFDVLTASPKLTSPDGETIEIIGRGSPLILVDRQPIISNEELRAIPANMIESIEIITNPSSKYKGQGAGNGVIEVYTKNFALEGYNMNISTSGGVNTQLQPTGSLSYGLNFKRKKFSMNGYLGASYNQSNAFGVNEGESTDSSDLHLISNFNNQNYHTWMYYQLKGSYQINKSQKITAGFRGHGSYGGSENITEFSYSEGAQINTYNSSNSDRIYTWQNNSGFINYQVETDTNKSNFEVNLNFVQKASNNSGNSFNTYESNISGISNDFSLRNESYDRPLVAELRLNYEHIFDTTGWELNTGLSWNELRNAKIYNQYNYLSGDWVADPLFSNSYNYAEHIGTVYAELTKNWDKFGFRIGVTGEYTGLEGFSNTLNKQFIDSVYFRPFPSASILLQPTDNVGLTLSYSAGIDRPQFSNYDPFVRIQDSLNISYGNPYLRPSVSHYLSFDLDLFYAYGISVYVSQTIDPISELSFVDSNFINTSTPWNARSDKSIGFDLNAPLQLKWLQGWNSFWFSYSIYEFTEEFNREEFTNISFGFYSYLTFLLPKNISIMNQIQISRWGDSNFTSNAPVRWGLRFTKKYMNNDFQVYLDVSNILAVKNKYVSYYNNFVYRENSQYQFTSFKLGLYYKFGRLKQSTHIQDSNAGQSGRI